jgi:hypothetical protein
MCRSTCSATECAVRFLRDYRRAGARPGDAWTVLQFLGYLRALGCILSPVALRTNARTTSSLLLSTGFSRHGKLYGKKIKINSLLRDVNSMAQADANLYGERGANMVSRQDKHNPGYCGWPHRKIPILKILLHPDSAFRLVAAINYARNRMAEKESLSSRF